MSTGARQAHGEDEARGAQEAQAFARRHSASFISPYAVRLEGDGITLRDRMQVSQAMLVMLEQGLGGPDHVIACFRAWQKQRENGFDWMNKIERDNARTWQQAFDHSAGVAAGMLSRPGAVRFIFELRIAQDAMTSLWRVGGDTAQG